MNKAVSKTDLIHLSQIRRNVQKASKKAGSLWGRRLGICLDIAPQVHEGARPFLSSRVIVKTLDINPSTKPDFVGDICAKNKKICKSCFDIVFCTEVLEHTINPFAAMVEIKRILKKGGMLVVSAPFDFRIHGPLPDCWRFSIHGWQQLLKGFTIKKTFEVTNPKRFLMPVHYAFIAFKK